MIYGGNLKKQGCLLNTKGYLKGKPCSTELVWRCQFFNQITSIEKIDAVDILDYVWPH